MNILLEASANGVILPVKGVPGARKNELRGTTDGMLKVCCTQIPEKGKATRAIQEVIVKSLKLKRSQVTLICGETDPHKKFFIADITVEELQGRLKALIE